MSTISKCETLLADTDKLILRGLFDRTSVFSILSQVVEAEWIEGVCVGIDTRVGVDGHCWDFDCDTGGDCLAVRQRELR